MTQPDPRPSVKPETSTKRESLPYVALLPGATAAVLLSMNGETSVDLGWHLETGRRILAGEGIPGPDPYLFTSRGAEWIDLHWLFQVLVAAVHSAAGIAGLAILKTALVVAAIVIPLRIPGASRPSVALGILLSLLAAAVFSLRAGLRPEHVSYVILAAEIYLLESARTGRSPRRLLLLPALQLVWTNCQGLFVLGIALEAAYLAGEFVAARAASLRRDGDSPAYSARALRTLALAAILSVAAAFANPYGIDGAAYPFLLATRLDPSDPLFQTIGELRSTLSFEFAPAGSAAFLLLLVLAAAAAISRPLRAPSLSLAAAGLAVVAAGAYRNAPLLPLVALPLALFGLSPALAEAKRVATAVAAAAAILFAMVAADAAKPGLFGPFLAVERPSIPSSPSGVRPEAAASFLERTGAGTRVFCDSSDASWLTWRLRGTRRFFMDTRTEVVHENVFSLYHAVLQEPGRAFDAVAARERIDAVVIHMNRPKMGPLLHHLLQSSTFALAFESDAEAVFLRRDSSSPANAPALAEAPGREAAKALAERFPLAPRSAR